jgi:Histidine kinase
VSRVGAFLRRYGLDVLIVIAAIEMALEVAIRYGAPTAPTTPRWFAVPASALIVLPLLARRRFPFAAPVALWVVAAVVSFVDGRLVPFTTAATVAGLVAAFLLGNLPDRTQARAGLVVVLGAAAILMYNNPSHTTGELVIVPAMFFVGWLAGLAVRQRSAQAEEAEDRAARAERERAAAARIAVAEERARIARELHDIVAHSLSVMALQVGAVRHRLPQSLTEDKDALIDAVEAGQAAHLWLRNMVAADLAKRYSPEQIAGRLRVEFPDRPEMQVSAETIYQSLYVQSRGALKHELTRCLRTGRAVRKPCRKPGQRKNRIPNMINVSERPAEADGRAVPGHWEGDLIIGHRLRGAHVRKLLTEALFHADHQVSGEPVHD